MPSDDDAAFDPSLAPVAERVPPDARRRWALGLAAAALVVVSGAATISTLVALEVRHLAPGTFASAAQFSAFARRCQWVVSAAVPFALAALWLGRRCGVRVWNYLVPTLLLVPVPWWGARWVLYRVAAWRGVTIVE